MLSTARKKNIALLNLSSQCIAFMEKCISVPHDRTNIFCFPCHEKEIFSLRKVLKLFLHRTPFFLKIVFVLKFLEFEDHNVVDVLVRETNRYGKQHLTCYLVIQT